MKTEQEIREKLKELESDAEQMSARQDGRGDEFSRQMIAYALQGCNDMQKALRWALGESDELD